MYVTLRKALLVSTMGVCGLVSAPVGFSLIASGPAHPFAIAALADDDDSSGRGGSDDGGHDDRDNDDRGGNRGPGNDHDDDDDDDDDNRGPGNRDDDDDDDDDDDRVDNRGPGNRHDVDRPEVALSVSEESLRGLLNGSLIAVDDLGRVLEVEIEIEDGVRVVTVKPGGGDARRNPGPITTVSIRPASAL